MEKYKELVSSNSVRCPKLQDVKHRGYGQRTVTIDALVQNFADGATRVLCEATNDGGRHCEENEDQKCHFLALSSDSED